MKTIFRLPVITLNGRLSAAIHHLMNDASISLRRTLVVTLLTLLTAGCATTKHANTALVIGQVTLSRELPKPATPLRSITTVVRFSRSGVVEVFNLTVRGTGGFFSVRMPPGSYSVFEVSFSELNWAGEPLECTRQRLVATFEVPENVPVVYIGNLKLTLVDAVGSNIETSRFWQARAFPQMM